MHRAIIIIACILIVIDVVMQPYNVEKVEYLPTYNSVGAVAHFAETGTVVSNWREFHSILSPPRSRTYEGKVHLHSMDETNDPNILDNTRWANMQRDNQQREDNEKSEKIYRYETTKTVDIRLQISIGIACLIVIIVAYILPLKKN